MGGWGRTSTLEFRDNERSICNTLLHVPSCCLALFSSGHLTATIATHGLQAAPGHQALCQSFPCRFVCSLFGICLPRRTPLGNKGLLCRIAPGTRMTREGPRGADLSTNEQTRDFNMRQEESRTENQGLGDPSSRTPQLPGDLGPVATSLSLAFLDSEGPFLPGTSEGLRPGRHQSPPRMRLCPSGLLRGGRRASPFSLPCGSLHQSRARAPLRREG